MNGLYETLKFALCSIIRDRERERQKARETHRERDIEREADRELERYRQGEGDR